MGLVLLTLVAYWSVLHNGFINVDDDQYVTNNFNVMSGISADGIAWAFTTFHAGNWHPLTWISIMLDCQLFGQNPTGHHLMGLLIHIANTLLLFALLSWMTGRAWRSAFVAALFAVHPLHVESVAWAAERKDVLSTMLWLLTTLAYVWYTRQPQVKRYLLVAGLFALGLLAKPMLVTLPLALLIVDYWPLGRLQVIGYRLQAGRDTGQSSICNLRSAILEKIPLFALAAASCAVTFAAQRSGGAVVPLDDVTLSLRLGNALISYVSYLGKMFWPRGLAIMYPSHHDVSAASALGAAVVVAAITIAVVRLRAARPYLMAGWLWYIVTLIPVIGIVQVGNQAMADRYTYIPLIGVFVALAWGIAELGPLVSSDMWRRAAAVAAGVVILALSFGTRAQVGYWRNSITLSRHALTCTSGNYIAHGWLAAALATEGKIDAAIAECRRAVSIAPQYARPHEKLGRMLASDGQIREAMRECRKALEIDPKLGMAHYDLGRMMDTLGNMAEARREYEEALRLQGSSPEAAYTHNGLGQVLGKQGHMDQAARQFEESLRSDPRLYEARINYGRTLAAGGRSQDAAAVFREALRLKPGDPDARRGLGTALAEPKGGGNSIEDLRKAVETSPNDYQAHYKLGVALETAGEQEEAATEYQQAIRLKPGSAMAHNNLGLLLGKQGRLDEAVAEFHEALRLNPRSADTECNLAVALSMQGKQDDAMAALKNAVKITPGHTKAHENLAVMYFQRQDYAKAWEEVKLCRKYGGNPPASFLQNLSAKMPEP